MRTELKIKYLGLKYGAQNTVGHTGNPTYHSLCIPEAHGIW